MTILITAAALLAAPAVTQAPAEPLNVTAPTPAGGPAATPRARETRYCVKGEVTGSRLRHKQCRTRAEWLRDGFDPLAK